MKRLGSGGKVKIDGVEVACVLTWQFEEAPGTIDCEGSTDTSISLSVIFYEGYAQHTLKMNTIVDISLLPSGVMSDDESNYLNVSKCRVIGRSFNSGVDELVYGNIDFQSNNAVIYP